MIHHLLQPALAEREQLRDDTDELLRNVDCDTLDRFEPFAVDLLRQHLRLADRQLETLAAHQLDEDCELQLAASLYFPCIGARGRQHAQRNIAYELRIETLLHLARGQPRPLGAGERARVDPDRHRQARFVDRRHGQRPRIVGIGDRLTDRHLGQAGERDDLSGPRLVGGNAVECLGDVQLGHACRLDRPVGTAPRNRRALAQRPVANPQEREPADVRARVEIRDQGLQRMLGVVARRRDRVEQRGEQRAEIGCELVRGESGATRARVRVHDRELDLRAVRVEIEEQLVHLVDDLGRPRVAAIDLVDHEHDGQLPLQRLTQDEPRLRQRPLGRVDEQQHAVHHRQRTLHLAAEVGVARRVDDVDPRVAERHRRVLGEDRDALLALEIHRVHHALRDVLVLAERAGLPEHRVDQRRLPVVDVRDDRDVAQVIAASEHD